MYKLIAIDMDGTLLNKDEMISERNKYAIERVRNKGIKVVIASGRPIHGLEAYLKELKLVSDEDYVMSYNGGMIQKVETKEVLVKNVLRGQDLHDLYKVAKQLNVNIHAFSDRGCITPKINTYSELEGRMNGIPVYEINYDEVKVDEEIIKVMFIDDEEIIDRVIKDLPEELYKKYNIVRSMPFFLEFLSKESGKGQGIKRLINHLGIRKEEVICIGDAGNDIDMLKFAGVGIAMGNALEEVKQIADYVTKSNQEDGVAYAIEKFVG